MTELVARTAALGLVLFQCVPPRGPEPPARSVAESAAAPVQPDSPGPGCQPRFAQTPANSLHTPDFARRVQQALERRYPKRAASDPDVLPEGEGVSLQDRLEFALVSERWGAEGPVPWVQATVPRLERSIGPVALYRTEFWTGEFEYPWVSALVVAREASGELALDVVLSPSFIDQAKALTALLAGACAPSPAAQIEMTRLATTLYALGDARRVTGGGRDGSCTIAEFHLYADVWRVIAVVFSDWGLVRDVYAFNPKDENDTALRASVCHGAPGQGE